MLQKQKSLDISAKSWGSLIDLIKDGKFGLESGADKVKNLIIASRFFFGKLIAWKSENLQAYMKYKTRNNPYHGKEKHKREYSMVDAQV